jgi:hypothetical protein
LALVLQILLAVVILTGLITVIMSVKNWHWAQMLLLLAIFFSSIGSLVLGLEVYRIHRTYKAPLPALEQQLADVEAKNQALQYGADAPMAAKVFVEGPPFDVEAEGSMPGVNVWVQRLQDVIRQRGQVWRGVAPAGPVDAATNRVPVRIDNPKPHGLKQDAIVYVFEQGEPNAAAPADGGQFLGEFKVVQASEGGAVLESVVTLDQRTGNRLANSQKPWVIYAILPTDSHELFAGVPAETLKQWFSPAIVEQYLRDGQVLEDGANEPNRAAFDENGRRLGPDNEGDVAQWRYDRPLRDYGYLFEAAHRRFVQLSAQRTALQEDIKKLTAANDIAKQLGALRTEEKDALAGDLEHMQADRAAIEAHLATVATRLANAQQEVAALLKYTAEQADQLRAKQQRQLDEVDRRAPAPGSLLGTTAAP